MLWAIFMYYESNKSFFFKPGGTPNEFLLYSKLHIKYINNPNKASFSNKKCINSILIQKHTPH